MLVTDAEPDRFAPLAPPAPLGLRGFGWCGAVLRRDLGEEFATCPKASVRAPLGGAPSPTSDQKLPLAGALLLITGRERVPSRRGCWAATPAERAEGA